MITQEILSKQRCIELIVKGSSVLNLSLSEIMDLYSKSVFCIKDCFSEDIRQKCIEVQLNKEELTLTCLLDCDEHCSSAFIFIEDEEVFDEFVAYATDTYDYSFVRSRFVLSDCFLQVKELNDRLYLSFYTH